ncbi:MAG: regulator of sigma E protease, partial [Bacteroidia bacterium]
GSPAALAGIVSGDRLVAVRGGDQQLDLATQLLTQMLEKQSIEVQVKTGEQDRWLTIEPDLSKLAADAMVGIGAPAQQIRAMRGEGLAKSIGLRIGDNLVEVGGTAIFDVSDLEQLLAVQPEGAFSMTVLRDAARVTLTAASATNADRSSLLTDLVFGADLNGTYVMVTEQSAAEKAGLLTGDRVVRIDGIATSEWEDLRGACRAAGAMSPPGTVTFSIQRQAELGAALQTLQFDVTPRKDSVASYGIGFEMHRYIYQAPDPVTAVKVGAACTIRFLQDSWMFAQRVFSGEVSADNVGGIITIGMVSSNWAQEGLAKLFFFLCILSMNLAFLNVLPIPMLDGGHMLFLLIEKIKGSPVSPSVQMLSQMVGMFMLLFLMIFVTVNDVMRWFFPG